MPAKIGDFEKNSEIKMRTRCDQSKGSGSANGSWNLEYYLLTFQSGFFPTGFI
jgi:hypothetical protein